MLKMMKMMMLGAALSVAGGVAGAVSAPVPSTGAQAELHCTAWFEDAACPDGTAAIAGYRGMGRGGDGWAGDAGGDGSLSDQARTASPRHFAQAEQTGVDNGRSPRQV